MSNMITPENLQPETLTREDQDRIRTVIRQQHGAQNASEGGEYTVYMHDDVGYAPAETSGLIGITHQQDEMQKRDETHPIRTDVDDAISRAAKIGFELGHNRAVEALAKKLGVAALALGEIELPLFNLRDLEIEGEIHG